MLIFLSCNICDKYCVLCLLTPVEPVARQLNLHKHDNSRQTNAILELTIGNNLTWQHCAVRCARESNCRAFNFGVTSDGKRICEEITNYQISSIIVVTEDGWSCYTGLTCYLMQYGWFCCAEEIRVLKTCVLSRVVNIKTLLKRFETNNKEWQLFHGKHTENDGRTDRQVKTISIRFTGDDHDYR